MIIEKGKTSNGYAAKLIFFYNSSLIIFYVFILSVKYNAFLLIIFNKIKIKIIYLV